MPVPIVQRQRALAAVGEVRIGAEKQGNKPGRKLETFRLTSQQKELIDRAAQVYGGQPSKWMSPVGESWQVITNRDALPIMVVIGYSLTLMYELWEGSSKCVRRCDGETEMLTDAPCVCNTEGTDRCDIITRFMMLLPELGTSLGWRFRSTGEFAANELSGGVQIANELARGRVFVPATLRLTQRRSVASGEVRRYAVPVLDFDPRLELGPVPPVDGEVVALPSGYTPLETTPTGVGVKEGIAQANRQEVQRTARSAAPIPQGDQPDDEFEEGVVTAPVPDDPELGGPTTPASTPAAGNEHPTATQGDAGSTPAPTTPVPTPAEPTEPTYISDAQRRRFHSIRRKHVVLEGRAKEILQEITGQPSTTKIPTHLYDRVIAALEAEETGQEQLL